MAKVIYNPKYFESGGLKKENTADIKRFVWSHSYWDLKVNEMKKFPDDVGEAMLRHFEFLVGVKPSNIKKIKEQIESKEFKCKHCEFETSLKLALLNHIKANHADSIEETKEFDAIEEAAPRGEFRGKKVQKLSPENSAGVPTGKAKDGDGVDWYGEGLTEDSGERE